MNKSGQTEIRNLNLKVSIVNVFYQDIVKLNISVDYSFLVYEV